MHQQIAGVEHERDGSGSAIERQSNATDDALPWEVNPQIELQVGDAGLVRARE